MKRALPDADTVKAAIDSVLEHAAATGRRPTITTVERRLCIPHATFYRHYSDLIDEHFRPRIPAPAQPAAGEEASRRTEANLRRLRQENTDLRRSLELYEEAIRQLALENDALRQGAAVLPLPSRARQTPRSQS
ncbi:exodeoxyribonuclease VII small subunit [Streptomyces sp. NPDC005281]|uniref:exodeoxyribonuclease VII small subunit n=1 Tax=Streptomyces sp. NPDC005281 TaxID=3155712 RepID=UPI00339E81E2